MDGFTQDEHGRWIDKSGWPVLGSSLKQIGKWHLKFIWFDSMENEWSAAVCDHYEPLVATNEQEARVEAQERWRRWQEIVKPYRGWGNDKVTYPHSPMLVYLGAL